MSSTEDVTVDSECKINVEQPGCELFVKNIYIDIDMLVQSVITTELMQCDR